MHGYVKDQIAFAKRILAPMESDKISWKISRAKPQAETLYLISYLKFIGYTTPFLTTKDSRKEMKSYIKESLSFLPQNTSQYFLNKHPIFQQLESDTTNNISKFTHLIVRKIVRPIFEGTA